MVRIDNRKRREPRNKPGKEEDEENVSVPSHTQEGEEKNAPGKATRNEMKREEEDDDPEARGAFEKFSICKNTRKQLASLGFSRLLPVQFLSFDYVYHGR